MTDNKNQLREDAIEFAIQISDLCDEIKGCSVYVNQIVRSSSSIGANIHEAKYAQSKADFINKLEISLKECSETEYWLELIFRKGKMPEPTYKDLRNKCGSIRRRLISSITTAKGDTNAQIQILLFKEKAPFLPEIIPYGISFNVWFIRFIESNRILI